MDFDKLMKKKKGKPMSDVEKDAKMSVVKEMQSMASDAMRGSFKDAIAKKSGKADDKEAGELSLDNVDEALPIVTPEGEENLEADSDEEDEDCSEEELDAKLAKLMSLKQKLAKKD